MYPGLALGLSLLVPPLELAIGPSLVGIAVIKASLPKWKRTLQHFQKTRRFNSELLDSLWILFHTISGEMLAPALSLCLMETANALRDRTAIQEQRQRPDLIPNRLYWIERKGRRRRVLVNHMIADDQVILGAGDLVPADGRIIKGEGLIDDGELTGDSNLITCEIGDFLLASTLIVKGQIMLEVKRLGQETRISQMADSALKKPEDEDTRISDLMEELGNQAVLPALAASALLFAGSGNIHQSLAPLQLDFAQGVGVSAPIPVLATLKRVAQEKVLIKGGQNLELLSRVNAIVFDKTGILTERTSVIETVKPLRDNITADEVLRLGASASAYMLHPFSMALLKYSEDRNIKLANAEAVDSSDIGIRSMVEGNDIVIGTNHYLSEHSVNVDADYHRSHASVISDRSIRYLAKNGEIIGVFAYTNPLRTESATTIRLLGDMGIPCYMMTGDSSMTADAVAYKLGFKPSNTYANLSAELKVSEIERLRLKHGVIAFVGDSTNDGPALSKADIGISLEEASDLARESADMILLDNSLLGIIYSIKMARQSMSLVNQNIALVITANIAAVTGSVFFNLSPLASVLLNNGSTILAGLNGMQPLLRPGERIDPTISQTLLRDENTLLGMAWRKRNRSSLKELLDHTYRSAPA